MAKPYLTNHRRNLELDFEPVKNSGGHPAPNLEEGMTTNQLAVFPTANSYESLAHVFCNDENIEPQDSTNQRNPTSSTSKPKNPTNSNKRPPPIYIHTRIDSFLNLSKNLWSNSKGEFHLKYHGNKTRINFENMGDYVRFKSYCLSTYVQFHTYATEQDKILAVVVRGLLKINKKKPKLTIPYLQTHFFGRNHLPTN